MTRIVDFIFLIFAAFLGKKALLLSVFAFAPSVLANDIPLATLSVDNIQVRAEWNMVGDSANHFSVEGGTLMLTADIEAGDTFIATVEVRDKFSTLNPSYEDLATTVMITAVIRCGAECTEYLNANAPLISVAVTVEYGVPATEYVVPAVEGRAVTVTTAFAYNNTQFFWLNDVKLANILNELYTIKVIIDDGKAFIIDDKPSFYPKGSRGDVNADIYEYSANLTVGSDSVDKQSPHEVIVLNNCPPIYEVTTPANLSVRKGVGLSSADRSKVKAYAFVYGSVYKVSGGIVSTFGGLYKISLEGYQGETGSGVKVKFSDHFLCGTG